LITHKVTQRLEIEHLLLLVTDQVTLASTTRAFALLGLHGNDLFLARKVNRQRVAPGMLTLADRCRLPGIPPSPRSDPEFALAISPHTG
jgi:hypothetical protein